jgi:hypothetical protein
LIASYVLVQGLGIALPLETGQSIASYEEYVMENNFLNYEWESEISWTGSIVGRKKQQHETKRTD